MKSGIHIIAIIIALLLCNISVIAMAETLTLPLSTKIIEEEAFYGDYSLDKVVLPEGIQEIQRGAFEDSSLSEINLPDSLVYIDDTAFDGPDQVTVFVNEGSFAFQWAVENEYIPEWIANAVPLTMDDEMFFDVDEMTDTVCFSFTPEKDGCYSFCIISDADMEGMLYDDRYLFNQDIDELAWDSGENNISLLYSLLAGKKYYFTTSFYSDSTTKPKVYVTSNVLVETPTSEFEYEITDGKCEITNYNGDREVVNIPEKIEGYEVTSIGEWAFAYCYNLTSVTIPNSVISIGDRAFFDCDSLTCVVIPNGVTSIGDRAFKECGKLASIVIPDSVTHIGEGVFWDCDELTSITLSNSITSISDYAFKNCERLMSITIPDSVTSIGEDAFGNCVSLMSVTIPNSVISIGEDAFFNCNEMTKAIIPSSVTSIGEDAFRDCADGFTIIGEAGSCAEAYAIENDISFTVGA